MKLKIDSIGFAQSDKYIKSLNCLRVGTPMIIGGIVLTVIGVIGVTHSSTWCVSATDEQRNEIIDIFKAYNEICT